MTRRFVDQLRDGDGFADVFVAADKQLRVNRKGDTYIQLDLRDRTGGLPARLWNAGEAVFDAFDNGDFVRAEGKVQMFQGALQAILTHLDYAPDDAANPADFMPHTPHDVGQLLDRLRGYLLKLGDPHLRAVAECFLMDDAFMAAFAACPAGVRLHHAYVGGLLEHTVTMMDIAEKLLPFYPGTDRDLVLIGTFLHDAGKTRELSYGRAFGYTDEGQLIGHISLGVEMLVEKAALAPSLTGEPVPRETLVRLKHLILSHHGTHEFGSPKVPMTPEATLLHLIDTTDTRMHMVLKELKEDARNLTAWTPYNGALGRRIYKGGAHGDLFDTRGETYD